MNQPQASVKFEFLATRSAHLIIICKGCGNEVSVESQNERHRQPISKRVSVMKYGVCGKLAECDPKLASGLTS